MSEKTLNEEGEWVRYEVYRADNGFWYVYGMRDGSALHECLTDTTLAHATAEAAWSELFPSSAGPS